MDQTLSISGPVGAEFRWLLQSARVPSVRSMREFAEAELVIPDGQYRGRRFRVDRQPFTRLLLEELDNPRWRDVFIAGPSQSGKTYIAFGLPLIYHTAELREPFVVGLPDMRMAQNKWRIDIEPIFRASPRLEQLLPTKGPGSRGGEIKDTVTLTNGAVIKFMTAGGEDTSKAGFTARVLGVTEAARFSTQAEASVEADPLRQLRARLRSYQRSRRRVYVEGTLTVDEELPWTARQFSSQSRIVCPCPHCGQWITPGREQLGGWEGAHNELEAAEGAAWFCGACGEAITEAERRTANENAQLVHAGQEIDAEGEISGEAPPTTRLWFHWTAFHNLFQSAADLAVEEWQAAQLEPGTQERENADRELAQFLHSETWRPVDLEHEPLPEGSVAGRAVEQLPRGAPPADTAAVTVGVDCGMYRLHWVAICWRSNWTGHVLDYNTVEVLHRGGDTAGRRKHVKARLAEALEELRDYLAAAWRLGDQRLELGRVFVDAGYLSDTVHAFCRDAGPVYFAALGRGTGQQAGYQYAHPSALGRDVKRIGDGYHLRVHRKHRQLYAIVDSDAWKSTFQEAFRADAGERGSLSIFHDLAGGHKTYERHVRSERPVRKHHPRHGLITVWEAASRANHYLDASYLAAAAGHLVGFRFTASPQDRGPELAAQAAAEAVSQRLTTPDGRDFLDTPAPH